MVGEGSEGEWGTTGDGGSGRGVGVLPSPSSSSLCSLHNRPMNARDQVLRQGRDFNQGAGRRRRWQASGSKISILLGSGCQVLL